MENKTINIITGTLTPTRWYVHHITEDSYYSIAVVYDVNLVGLDVEATIPDTVTAWFVVPAWGSCEHVLYAQIDLECINTLAVVKIFGDHQHNNWIMITDETMVLRASPISVRVNIDALSGQVIQYHQSSPSGGGIISIPRDNDNDVITNNTQKPDPNWLHGSGTYLVLPRNMTAIPPKLTEVVATDGVHRKSFKVRWAPVSPAAYNNWVDNNTDGHTSRLSNTSQECVDTNTTHYPVCIDDTGPTILINRMHPDVNLPSKRGEDAGYDLYAYFDDDYLIIHPNQTKLIPTGIRSVFTDEYYIKLEERGSTGTIGLAQRSGVIDSGYRGEWCIPLTNTTDRPIAILKNDKLSGAMVDMGITCLPYTKAICQFIINRNHKSVIKEISDDELAQYPSERGTGRLGSSNK